MHTGRTSVGYWLVSEQISVDNRLIFVDVCSQGPINFPIQNDVSRMRRDLGHRLMTMGVRSAMSPKWQNKKQKPRKYMYIV